MDIFVPRFKEIVLRRQVNAGLAGRFTNFQAFRGRPIAGTGRPQKFLVVDPKGRPVEDFFDKVKAIDKLCDLNAIDPNIPAHLHRYIHRPGFTLREIPRIPQTFIEEPGSRHTVAENVNNLILDQGLDHKGNNSSFLDHCHIGTGTAAEDVSDTALAAFTRAHDSIEDNTLAAQGSAPYYGKDTTVYRFDPPGSSHNYAEVGISTQAATGNLFSRARIKDGGGSPTTISVLADEWLDVTYELRNYPDWVSADDTGTVDGYDYTLRASSVTAATGGGWADGIDNAHGFDPGTATRTIVYSDDAVLGAVTSFPTATDSESTLSTGSVGSYTNGTYNADITYSWGLNDGNLSGTGIEAIMFRSVWGRYQMLVDPVIAKDVTKVLDITLNFAWTRAPIS